jgi:hypothetical protein
MGFCLFREAGTGSAYFAVNVSHVQDLTPEDGHGHPACLIALPTAIENYRPVASGALEQIQKHLMQASKIGLNKVEVELLTGQKSLRSTPLLINNPDRIMLIRELSIDEVTAYETEAPVISQIFFVDGTQRLMAARPGIFAARANAGAKVPLLEA